MKFTGTNGVWKVGIAPKGETENIVIKNGINLFCVEDEFKKVVAIIGRVEGSEQEANAKLISAAPDLFEAIQYYFQVLEEVRGKDFLSNPDHVLSKMLNAMKKATDN